VARTENVCEPSVRPASAFGLVHAAYAAPSSLHSNVAPASLVNEKLGAALFEGSLGFAVSVTTGAEVSIVQVYAVEAPVFPAASVARTENVWLPAASAVYAFGDEQDANEPASSLHSKLAPA